jgi:hypothetical protein
VWSKIPETGLQSSDPNFLLAGTTAAVATFHVPGTDILMPDWGNSPARIIDAAASIIRADRSRYP